MLTDLQSNYFDGNLPTADIQKLHAKYAPTEFALYDHVPTMYVDTIRAKL